MLARTSKIRIQPISETRRERSWAIYGRSGTGKTTFASSLPKPLLLLDVRDEGTDSIYDVKGIEVARISEWGQFEEIYDMLSAPKCKYKAVVIDTMTQAQLLAVNAILAKARRPAVEQLDWGTLTMQQWGAVGALMKEMITLWRNLPIEVCFIAQERVFEIASEGGSGMSDQLIPEIGPALSPATAAHLNACVSVIANCFIKVRRRQNEKKREVITMTHSMRLGPHPVYTTKARKPKRIELPAEVDNPTWQSVKEIIEGNE